MNPPPLLSAVRILDLVTRALAEDLGSGDLTTRLLFAQVVKAEAVIRAKEEATLAGLPLAEAVFKKVDPKLKFKSLAQDGDRVQPGTQIARIVGDGRSLLKGERVALNFLQRLSGIATLTARFVETIRGTKAAILDTRKTTPGLRGLEKYAVRMGGGRNHRMNLSDGILIKDNHIALAGSLKRAVEEARRKAPRGLKVEVEARNLNEVEDALSAKADRILLDNMTIPHLKEALLLINGRALTEASGGIHLNNVREFAGAGVDFISIGALTHSAPAVDLSMDITPSKDAP
ncbi:MAG TPA: carboxylating nicotinate-nucleotide diphosphorylase [Nitrospiria bacterium]|jgi:nicotinate-nucleotide pyrophosphorylase (carboxylating)|nr:carboxylating nicotinate-nucleotide diphosphorylase [Nitrospiria bacterium]